MTTTPTLSGASGYILKSSDTEKWNIVKDSNFLNDTYNEVAFGNGIFVAVTENGKIMTSTNGTSWTTLNVGVGTDNLMNIDYGNGKYSIGSRISNDSGSYVYLSTTGATNSWSKVTVVAYGSALNEIITLRFSLYDSRFLQESSNSR